MMDRPDIELGISLVMPSSRVHLKRGAWSEAEDLLLSRCIEKYGPGNWGQVPHLAGLNRCGKSCRLRWFNYLQPNIKRGEFEPYEVDLIIRMHKLLGNRWSLIAGRLPGRTGNGIKNYFKTYLLKKRSCCEWKLPLTNMRSAENNHMMMKTKVFKPVPQNIYKNSQSNKAPTPIWMRSLRITSNSDDEERMRKLSINDDTSSSTTNNDNGLTGFEKITSFNIEEGFQVTNANGTSDANFCNSDAQGVEEHSGDNCNCW